VARDEKQEGQMKSTARCSSAVDLIATRRLREASPDHRKCPDTKEGHLDE
jgi:hypothetical protein